MCKVTFKLNRETEISIGGFVNGWYPYALKETSQVEKVHFPEHLKRNKEFVLREPAVFTHFLLKEYEQ